MSSTEPSIPHAAPALGEPAVTMRGITKRFPGVLANDQVDFEALVGEVHALLGENGAGKSTLSNILTGLYRADEGELELYGQPADFQSPRDALDAGIGMVHQHFRLVEPFTVAENVVLGDHRDLGRSFRLHSRAIEQRVAELGERYGIAVEPRARIWQLSVGEQQRVEILKALYREARVLILDEPTAVLTPQEAEGLFVTLRSMAAEGRTIIFISHKLHEVTAVADRVTVLRGGRSIGTVDTAGATSQSLAALMVGRDVDVTRRPRGREHDRRGDPRGRRALGGRRPRRGGPPLGLAVGARGRGARDRRRRGQRAARARRGGHRHAAAHGGRRAGRRRCSAHGRPARGDHGRDRARARGPAPHRRRAQPQHRVEHRAEVVPHRRRRPVPPARAHSRPCRRDDPALRREGTGAADAGPPALGRQPAEGRARARVLERAARARGRGADARPRRRRDRDRPRLPPRGRGAAGRGAPDQRGPRRGADPGRPHRRDVRGRDRRRGRRAQRDGRGARAADGRRPRQPAEAAGSDA